MRIKSTITVMALLGSVLTVLAPAVGALDIGCIRADASGHVDVTTVPAGTASLFTPPGADVTGWTPECVIIPNGGTVTFTQRDAIGHGVQTEDECIMLGVMSTLGARSTTSLMVEFDPSESTAFLMQNGDEPNFCSFEEQDGVVVIPYFCEIHGPGMPGVIKVEL